MICQKNKPSIDIHFIGVTSKSTSDSPKYISCYSNGSFTNNYVSGTCWTKTSTSYNTLNPNCAFKGTINVYAGCSGGMSHDAPSGNQSSAICKLSFKSGYSTISSTHFFSSTAYGSFSHSLTAY